VGIGNSVVLKTTRLGKYNRTTVPEEVRKLLGLREVDEIAWVLEGNGIVVEKVEKGGGYE